MVLALISLAMGALAPLAIRQVKASQEERTRKQLERIYTGMYGDPSHGNFGYLGDMGRLPVSLVDLNQRGSQPSFAIDASYGLGAGYNGPYAPHANAAFVDAWGSTLQYAPGVAQVRSAGPDRAFGTADDLVHPLQAPPTTAALSISVRGIPNDGGPPEDLTSSDVAVYVARVADGTRGDVVANGTGPFWVTSLPLGLQGIRAIGQGSYSGSTARSVISLVHGSHSHTLVLRQP